MKCKHCDLDIRPTHAWWRNEYEHVHSAASFCDDNKNWAWPKKEEATNGAE
jgi:hypothetical protein